MASCVLTRRSLIWLQGTRCSHTSRTMLPTFSCASPLYPPYAFLAVPSNSSSLAFLLHGHCISATVAPCLPLQGQSDLFLPTVFGLSTWPCLGRFRIGAHCSLWPECLGPRRQTTSFLPSSLARFINSSARTTLASLVLASGRPVKGPWVSVGDGGRRWMPFAPWFPCGPPEPWAFQCLPLLTQSLVSASNCTPEPLVQLETCCHSIAPLSVRQV